MERLGGGRPVKPGRARGCLETAGVAVFALLLGGFLASTWLGRAGPAGPRPGGSVEAPATGLDPSERARIRVEVLNGSGVAGAASRMTTYLRDRGFDVVDFGNADRFDHERTVVIDRIGDPRRAREVAATLRGVPIRTEPDSTLYLDVTVVIGDDLEDVLRPERAPDAGPTGWRAWLDRIPRPWK